MLSFAWSLEIHHLPRALRSQAEVRNVRASMLGQSESESDPHRLTVGESPLCLPFIPCPR